MLEPLGLLAYSGPPSVASLPAPPRPLPKDGKVFLFLCFFASSGRLPSCGPLACQSFSQPTATTACCTLVSCPSSHMTAHGLLTEYLKRPVLKYLALVLLGCKLVQPRPLLAQVRTCYNFCANRGKTDQPAGVRSSAFSRWSLAHCSP